MKNIKFLIKLREILFLFYLFLLCFTCQSAHLDFSHKEELFDISTIEETKRTAVSVYSSLVRAQRDRLTGWHQKSEKLKTLSKSAINELYRAHQHATMGQSLPFTEQKQQLEALYESGRRTAMTNLSMAEGLLASLASGDRQGMEDLFCELVTQSRTILQTRMFKPEIPLTIPDIMKDYPPHTREIAENSRIQRWDESAIMKILSAVVPQETLDKIFEPLMQDPLFGGHFFVLKAYILGLEETPPLPDHYMYRLHKQNLERSTANLERLKTLPMNPRDRALLRAQEERVLRTSVPLVLGPLKGLEELETRAKAKLEASYQSQHPEPGPSLQIKTSSGKKKRKKKTLAPTPLAKNGKLSQDGEATEDSLRTDGAAAAQQVVVSPQPFAASDESEGLALLPQLQMAEKFIPEEELSLSTPSIHSPELTEEEIEDTFSVEETADDAEAQKIDPSHLEPWKAYPRKKNPPQVPFAPQPELFDQAEAMMPIALKPKIHALWEIFSTEPSMEWSDFQTMITKIGFGIEPNGGSIRRILYPEIYRSTTGRRHLIVHEPHGAFTTVGPDTLSYLRSALSEDFGWSLRSFTSR